MIVISKPGLNQGEKVTSTITTSSGKNSIDSLLARTGSVKKLLALLSQMISKR
jgi:hypothetical protein